MFAKIILSALTLSASLAFVACGKSTTAPLAEKTFAVSSPTIIRNGVIPARHWWNNPALGCEGLNIRPALNWSGAPEGTKSFAVTVYDQDAPTSAGFWHWIAYNIPAGTKGISEGPDNLPAGTVQANNDLGSKDWFGSCPTADGRLHRYVYTVYALSTPKIDVASLPAAAASRYATFVMLQSAIGKATLEATAGSDVAPAKAYAAFKVVSPTLQEGAAIPQRHWFNTFGCTGENIRPALSWSGAPAGTKSFAVLVLDNDAPTGAGFFHWVAYNLPASATGIVEGPGNLPLGAAEGNTDLGQPGWFGSCPTDGVQHRYTYSVYALGTDKLDLPAGATAAFSAFNILGNAIGKASLNVTALK